MNSHILPLIALVISVGTFFTYVNPNWSGTIVETKAAIAADNEALDAVLLYTDQLNKLSSDRNKIDPEDIDRLTIFLPDSVDNVGLILDLNALAARSGLSLSNIDVSSNTTATNASGAPESTNPLGSADLNLSAVGTYSALKTFLGSVEKSQRLLDVRDLSIKGSETGVYSYQMRLRFYWLR